ncbi:MAG: hypothetical protein HRU17_02635 [Polyangiaceae bacterium]|nr:hypothetical protein [Polyangiaceae bacterium]
MVDGHTNGSTTAADASGLGGAAEDAADALNGVPGAAELDAAVRDAGSGSDSA